jgi:cytochrome bd-type quinol oxidase subunit 2
MPVHLIFLFFFQGGLAFMFTFVLATVLLKTRDSESRERAVRGIRRIRLIILGATAILPVAMFAAYYGSLPEGKSYTVALWPAAWILVILLAVVAALTIAIRKKED